MIFGQVSCSLQVFPPLVFLHLDFSVPWVFWVFSSGAIGDWYTLCSSKYLSFALTGGNFPSWGWSPWAAGPLLSLSPRLASSTADEESRVSLVLFPLYGNCSFCLEAWKCFSLILEFRSFVLRCPSFLFFLFFPFLCLLVPFRSASWDLSSHWSPLLFLYYCLSSIYAFSFSWS